MGIFNFLFNKKSKERKTSKDEQSVYDIPLTAEAEDKTPNLVLNPRTQKSDRTPFTDIIKKTSRDLKA